jgi:hypothetical protein
MPQSTPCKKAGIDPSGAPLVSSLLTNTGLRLMSLSIPCTLAYYTLAPNTTVKGFITQASAITLGSGPNVIKLFTDVIY